MNKIVHPIEPEELMAYLDGELSAERAAAAATHLSECAECQGVVGELRNVSQGLHAWKIEVPELKIPQALADALEQVRVKRNVATVDRPRWRNLFTTSGLSPAWIGGVAALVMVLAVSVSFVGRAGKPMSKQVGSQMELNGTPAAEQSRQYVRLEQFAQLQNAAPPPPPVKTETQPKDKDNGAPTTGATPFAGPMIIRTADLTLTTKEFDKARTQLEAILKRHHGYVGDLKVSGAIGSGRTLTATLRVPADQLEATLAELKALGRVEAESQGGQDVTSQYVDLQARLTNARNTEKRLTDLLAQRTGKLSDVLEVEQEVDRVRGEIEQMEAERKNMASQVAFATVNTTITEDYKAQLEVVPPSTASRLRNAAVEGYRSLVDGVVDVILFVLANGPSWLFWGAILFLPGRFAWKTMRRRFAQ